MEVRSGVGKSDGLTVPPAVRQIEDVCICGMMKLVYHMRLGRPEPARESNELLRRRALATQNQDLTCEECALDVFELCARQRLRNVDLGRFKAETRRQRFR